MEGFLDGIRTACVVRARTRGSRVYHFDAYRGDPGGFFRDALGWEPWDKQAEIAASVFKNRRTLVASCNGAGKTALAAAVVLAFIQTRRGARVVTTAPTSRQVDDELWMELRKMFTRARLRLNGQMPPRASELTIEPGWDAIGFATRGDAATEASSFHGYHSETGETLIVFDEAQGIQPVFWAAADRMMTSPGCRMMAIGNPIGTGSAFHKAAQSGTWEVFHVSAFDTPNVREKSNRYPGLVSMEWVEEMRRKYGEASPFYIASVLGQFPDSAVHSIFQPEWIRAAEERWGGKQLTFGGLGARGPIYVGVDVAREGDDSSAWVCMEGNGRVDAFHEVGGHDLMSVTGRTVKIVRECLESYWDRAIVAVDVTGMGAGVYDRLMELRRDGTLRADVRAVNFAERSVEPERWANMREELGWGLADALRDGRISFQPGIFGEELAEIRCDRFDSKGRSRLESKEEMKSRLGKSPDRFDALSLAWKVVRADAPKIAAPQANRALSWW